MPPELRRLMERYCQIAQLLPRGDDVAMDIALKDAGTRDQTRLALAEMDKVKAEIDAMLARARATNAK
jgi:hypothetical protein